MEPIEVVKTKLMEQVVETEIKISKAYDRMLCFIGSHRARLMKELYSFRDERQKEIETRNEEAERQFLIKNSFTSYCKEMKEKGSACDISRAANDLHARTVELVKTNVKLDKFPQSKINIIFTPSLMTFDDVEDLIGKLYFKG